MKKVLLLASVFTLAFGGVVMLKFAGAEAAAPIYTCYSGCGINIDNTPLSRKQATTKCALGDYTCYKNASYFCGC